MCTFTPVLYQITVADHGATIAGLVTGQLVAVFLIVHHVVIFAVPPHIVFPFATKVILNVLSVIAYLVAFAVKVIFHHTDTDHVVAVLVVAHHLILKFALVILGAFTVQLVAVFLIVHPLVVYHTLVAPFALNVPVTVLSVIAYHVPLVETSIELPE